MKKTFIGKPDRIYPDLKTGKKYNIEEQLQKMKIIYNKKYGNKPIEISKVINNVSVQEFIWKK